MAPPSSSDAALTLALENQTRALLSEIDKRFQSLDTKWESRVGALESQATASDFSSRLRADMEAHLTASDVHLDSRLCQIEEDAGARVAALESAGQTLDFWRPRVDSSIVHL
jgi:putative heme iron utilization protein